MGYPGPDPVARSLRTRKAGAIGLLLTEQVSYAFRDPGAVAFLEGLTLECDEARVGLLLVPASPDSEDVMGVAGAAVDGFVVYSMPDDDPHLAAALARPVPVGDLRSTEHSRRRPGRDRRRGGHARRRRPPAGPGPPADRA